MTPPPWRSFGGALARLRGMQPDLLALLAARALQLVGGLVVSVVLIWLYGLAAAGTYAIAILPAAAAIHLCSLGLPNALPRYALPNGERATIGLAASLLALLPLGLLAFGYGAVLGSDAEDAATIALFAWSAAAGGQVGIQHCMQVLQRRILFAPLTPFLHLVALGIAALFADGLLEFALFLTLGRLVGNWVGFATLRYARTTLRHTRDAVAQGLRFVPLDLMAAAGDLALIPALAIGLTRAEIGLFGLARQFLIVADSPGWSFVQARYPAMVNDLAAVGADVARRNERLAWISGLGTLVVAGIMALLVYRLPQLLPLLLIMLLPMPARYLNNFCDQALRAQGMIRECVALSLAKLALSLGLVLALAVPFGLWGAVAASAVISLVAGLLYRWRFDVHFPRVLPRLRLWRIA